MRQPKTHAADAECRERGSSANVSHAARTAGGELRNLCDVSEIIMGTSPPGDTYNTTGEGMPLINGPVEFSPGAFGKTVRTKFTTAPNKFCKANDLIICVRGSTTGRTNFAAFDACIGRGVAAIRARDYQPWINYFVRHKRDAIYSLGTGATFPNISSAALAELKVPVPPLAERRRIVGILDEAFAGIATAKANAKTNLQNAHALFESHLQAVFTQRRQGWVKDLVGSSCDVKHGYAFDGAEFSSDVPHGNPLVITPGNFTEDGRLLFNERNAKRFSGEPPPGFRFDVGDLVVVMTDLSSKMKILGKPAFVETDNVLHNQRIGRVVFLNDRIEKRLLYYFMLSDGFLKSVKGSATGTMVKHTAPKRILGNVIPFPRDRGMQRDIVSNLDSLRAETQRLASLYQQKLTAFDELKNPCCTKPSAEISRSSPCPTMTCCNPA